MTQCHECGEEFLEGTLFCGECGAYLMQAEDIQLTLEMPAAKASSAQRPTNPLDHRLGFGPKADRIILVIPSTGRRLSLDLGEEIAIGRADTGQGIWPEVDLTLDEGAESGVSRKHALVRKTNQGVVLVDLDSTNGTWVKETRLAPGRPYPLMNGDMIRFARLVVQVYFE